jgi:hypothetical protein
MSVMELKVSGSETKLVDHIVVGGSLPPKTSRQLRDTSGGMNFRIEPRTQQSVISRIRYLCETIKAPAYRHFGQFMLDPPFPVKALRTMIKELGVREFNR